MGKTLKKLFGTSCAWVMLVPLAVAFAGADRGIELYQAKNYAEAEKELAKVVEADPDNRSARYYLGLSLLEQEKYSEAKAQFRVLAEKNPEATPRPDQVKVGLARAEMELKEHSAAQSDLDEALSLKRDNPEVFLYRGKLQIHRENYPAAAKELDKAVELDPRSPQAHYYSGIAYSNMKRFDRMVDHFQMFLKLAPDAPEAKKVRSLLRSVR